MSAKSEQTLQEWSRQQSFAETMVPIIGELYRDRGVIVTIFGHSLVNKSPLEILELHRIARVNADQTISTIDTYPMLSEVARLDLGPSRIDLGNLVSHWRSAASDATLEDFVKDEQSVTIALKPSVLQVAIALGIADVACAASATCTIFPSYQNRC